MEIWPETLRPVFWTCKNHQQKTSGHFMTCFSPMSGAIIEDTSCKRPPNWGGEASNIWGGEFSPRNFGGFMIQFDEFFQMGLSFIHQLGLEIWEL